MTNKHKRITNQDSGFTLVEILIAMTLFSVILVLVFSALHTSNKSWLASERQIETNEEQRLVLSFIKRQISQTVPLLQLDGKENTLVFKGEEDSLQFVSSLPAHRGGGGLYLLSLSVDEGLTLHYQVVTSDIELVDELDDEKSKEQLLIANIDKIAFSYFGSEISNETPVWRDQWTDQKRLPDLVSMRITSKSASDYWPEVVIPVRTQISRGQPQFTLQNKGTAPRT
jgi:general secretion pathway protein J